MPRQSQEVRLHELGLPQDVVDIARNHRDLTPTAEKRVLDVIQEYEAAITSLKEEMNALELPKQWFTRKQLIKEVPTLQAKVNACKSLLSVKRRVPWETMGEIFEYYLLPGGSSTLQRVEEDEEVVVEEEDDDDSTGWFDDEVRITPGTLCLVCRHWKAIAIATPSLWSKIKVSAIQTTKEPWSPAVVPAPQIRGIWSWMDRVSAHPWELTIDVEENSGSWSTQEKVLDGVPLLQVLKRPATLHVKMFKISGTANSLTANGLDELTFPEVTSAVIDSTTWYLKIQEGKETPEEAAIPYLPKLTHLAFNNLHPLAPDGPKTIPVQVPWSQLTHLALGGDLGLSFMRAVFRQCVKLQKGTFFLGYVDDNADEDTGHVELPDLKELTTIRFSPFERPLVNISLPKLKRLRLYNTWTEPVIDFSNPSIFDNLTHLTIVSCNNISGEFVIDILDRIPTLEELFFTMSRGMQDAFRFLTYGYEGKFKLLHLKALGMHVWRERDENVVDRFPFEALTALVESRTQGVKEKRFSDSTSKLAPLEHLVLRLGVPGEDDDLTPQVEEDLEPFASYGLKMTVMAAWGQLRDDHPYSGRYYDRVWTRMLEQWPIDAGLDYMDSLQDYNLYP